MIGVIFKSIKSAITYINHILSIISNNSMLTKIWIMATAFLSAFFIPVLYAIIFVFCMIFLDLYYGLKVSVKLHKKIESHKGWAGTINKLKDAFVLLCSMRGIEYFLINDWVNTRVLTCGTALLISITEIWSVIENLNTLDPDGPWRLVGKFLKKKGEEYTGIDIDLKDNEQHDAK